MNSYRNIIAVTCLMLLSACSGNKVRESSDSSTITVNAIPWGEVYLDGQYMDSSPIVKEPTPTGRHMLAVKREGYKSYKEEINVSKDGHDIYTISMGKTRSHRVNGPKAIAPTARSAVRQPKPLKTVVNAAPLDYGKMFDLAKRSGCLACHAVDKKVVGPAWRDVARRYRGEGNARRTQLIRKVKQGGKGNWKHVTGGVPMPPYSPRVADRDIEQLVNFIMSLDSGSKPLRTVAPKSSVASTDKSTALRLAKKSGCLACHSLDKKVVGPAWRNVARRYRVDGNAKAQLIRKVKQGGKGNWTSVTGGVPMPPYFPRVNDQDIEILVDYILSLNNSGETRVTTFPSTINRVILTR